MTVGFLTRASGFTCGSSLLSVASSFFCSFFFTRLGKRDASHRARRALRPDLVRREGGGTRAVRWQSQRRLEPYSRVLVLFKSSGSSNPRCLDLTGSTDSFGEGSQSSGVCFRFPSRSSSTPRTRQHKSASTEPQRAPQQRWCVPPLDFPPFSPCKLRPRSRDSFAAVRRTPPYSGYFRQAGGSEDGNGGD